MNFNIKLFSLVLAMIVNFMEPSASFAESSSSPSEFIVESFELHTEIDQVILTWKLLADVEGAKIIVERAGMDMQFKSVGDGNEVIAQKFVDRTPQKGMSFYRLAIQYKDGSIDYQPTLSVIRGKLIKIS